MKRLAVKFSNARESFWFVPAVMTLAAVVLAFATLELDERLELSSLGSGPFGNVASADGARTLLGTIAGSMITVASLTFTITITSLSLTSSQFGPRLIRNFIRDPGNQVVLGTFIATFAYCLLVLRTVRGEDAGTFVPTVSMVTAVALALSSLAVLIYFISHISMSIQARQIISSIGRDLGQVIDVLYPEVHEEGQASSTQADDEWRPQGQPRRVYATRSGYIQDVRYTDLVDIARKADATINVPYRPGRFVPKGATIAEVYGDAAGVDDEERDERTCRAVRIGDDRSAGRDVEFFIDQLVEIAVRALSPGINDPFTAIACIDELGASLRQLAERKLPQPNHRDEDGVVRVHASSQTFEGAVSAAFNLLRQHGQTSVAVSVRLLETMAVLAEYTPSREHQETLQKHAAMVHRAAVSHLEEPADIEALDDRYRMVLDALQAGSAPAAG